MFILDNISIEKINNTYEAITAFLNLSTSEQRARLTENIVVNLLEYINILNINASVDAKSAETTEINPDSLQSIMGLNVLLENADIFANRVEHHFFND